LVRVRVLAEIEEVLMILELRVVKVAVLEVRFVKLALVELRVEMVPLVELRLVEVRVGAEMVVLEVMFWVALIEDCTKREPLIVSPDLLSGV